VPVVFGIVELDASQVFRVVFACLLSCQRNGLIATQTRGYVHWARVGAMKELIGFATNPNLRTGMIRIKFFL
jgi:hypothetical protein